MKKQEDSDQLLTVNNSKSALHN